MRTFQQLSKSGDCNTGIVEVHECLENPTEKIVLTYYFNYWTEWGRPNSEIHWSFVRNDSLVYSGMQDIPVGDWISTPKPWKEQLKQRIGDFVIEDA